MYNHLLNRQHNIFHICLKFYIGLTAHTTGQNFILIFTACHFDTTVMQDSKHVLSKNLLSRFLLLLSVTKDGISINDYFKQDRTVVVTYHSELLLCYVRKLYKNVPDKLCLFTCSQVVYDTYKKIQIVLNLLTIHLIRHIWHIFRLLVQLERFCER